MRLFQAALDTPLDSPFSATLSVHGLHFTVCAPSSLGGGAVRGEFSWRSLGRRFQPCISGTFRAKKRLQQKLQPKTITALHSRIGVNSGKLCGPISCDTVMLSLRYPISRDTFSGRLAFTQNCAIPPLDLISHRHISAIPPFCNVSRDHCAIPPQNKHKIFLRYYR